MLCHMLCDFRLSHQSVPLRLRIMKWIFINGGDWVKLFVLYTEKTLPACSGEMCETCAIKPISSSGKHA